jgi:adenosylcobinamide-GDP ribazoletransferase
MRDTLNLFARRFVLALQSSTRMRAAGSVAPETAGDDLPSASVAHVPGVGWLVGIAACLVFALVSLLLRNTPWDPFVAAVACTIATVLLTGALHESALFRFAEGVARPGNGHGILALVLLLMAKLALLAGLALTSERAVIAALFAGHVVSRFGLVVTQWAGSPEADTRSLRVGALWCLVPLALLVPAGGVALLVVPLITAALAGFAVLRFSRQRPDTAADRPGVVQQVCEVAFYLGAALAA